MGAGLLLRPGSGFFGAADQLGGCLAGVSQGLVGLPFGIVHDFLRIEVGLLHAGDGLVVRVLKNPDGLLLLLLQPVLPFLQAAFPFLQTLFLRGQRFALTGRGGIGRRTRLLQQGGRLNARVRHAGVVLILILILFQIANLPAKLSQFPLHGVVFRLDGKKNLKKIPTVQF